MQRQMHPNSLTAYSEVKPKISGQKQKILDALQIIKSGTMHNIADYMRVPLNTISGRFKALSEDNLIEGIGSIKNRTVWRLKT